MPETSYDCIVIGSGPGGYVAAIRAAQLGMKTAVIESDQVGGRCLNYACIPAKAVLRVADVLGEIREAGDYGITVSEPTVDFDGVGARRKKVIKTLTGGVAGLFKKNAIDVIEGHGVVTDDANVKVGGNFDGTEIGARFVILATGSVSKPLPGTRFGGRVIGTEEAWALTELPATLAVVGAGASGTEIASAYARLGSDVTLYEGLDRVLPTEDPDISKIAERGFKKQGIKVRTGVFVEDVTSGDDAVSFTVAGEPSSAEWLVIAAGRAPDVEGLGLEEAGIALSDDGHIEVDGAMRTSLSGVYAIGDLVHGPALAHKASDEGIIAAEDAAGLETHAIAYIDVPRATFCYPNVAQLRAHRAPSDRCRPRRRRRALQLRRRRCRHGLRRPHRPREDRRRQDLRRAARRPHRRHAATELIQELVNVRALEGGFGEIARMVHGHPTLSEAVMEAARDADGWIIHG